MKTAIKFGIAVSFVDNSDLEKVKNNVRKKTKMIFLETPANPTMVVCDIEEICKIAREICALSVVDNSFATLQFQRSLKLDADVVVHSSTKYIGGHADLDQALAPRS